MNWFQKLSARAKLLLAFVAVSAILGGVAAFALFKMGTINDSLEHVGRPGCRRHALGLRGRIQDGGDAQGRSRMRCWRPNPRRFTTRRPTSTRWRRPSRRPANRVEPTLITSEGKAAMATIKEDYPRYVAMCHETH